jgi:hypothetical protein
VLAALPVDWLKIACAEFMEDDLVERIRSPQKFLKAGMAKKKVWQAAIALFSFP